ncbi:unnamed protein product [Amoebophrya sp. A25]|nr:unnamed protein product [Amoebophrya sp. A25]|eukprot:GSA25T00009728001.1
MSHAGDGDSSLGSGPPGPPSREDSSSSRTTPESLQQRAEEVAAAAGEQLARTGSSTVPSGSSIGDVVRTTSATPQPLRGERDNRNMASRIRLDGGLHGPDVQVATGPLVGSSASSASSASSSSRSPMKAEVQSKLARADSQMSGADSQSGKSGGLQQMLSDFMDQAHPGRAASMSSTQVIPGSTQVIPGSAPAGHPVRHAEPALTGSSTITTGPISLPVSSSVPAVPVVVAPRVSLDPIPARSSKAEATTPPVTSRSNETWTGNSKAEVKHSIQALRAEVLAEDAKMRRSNSLTTLKKAHKHDEEDFEHPIRVARCELNAVQMRPVVNSELCVYISLKDIRTNAHWEDKPGQRPGERGNHGGHSSNHIADVADTNSTRPIVNYRWSRGPVIHPCVFHKHKTSTVRDTSKTWQFYCGLECLQRGWKGLPKDLWLDPDKENWTLQLKHDWEVISEERSYCPSVHDINRPLRFEVLPLDKNGEPIPKFAKSCTTGTVIPTPKEARTRRMLSFGGQFNAAWLQKQFKLMNWNILADVYATEAQYPYCEKFAISWMFRKHLIIKEIKSINADIVTLQEVQQDHYEEWFRPHLVEQGYEGVYQQKKHKSPLFHRGKFCVEGCATFFKKERFRQVDQAVVEFDEEAKGRINDPEALQRLSKGNVALVLTLEDLQIKPDLAAYREHNMKPEVQADPSKQLAEPTVGTDTGGHLVAVVNTHILADPEYTDVKIWQSQVLLDWLQNNVASETPLLVCGDFNSTPKSAVYELWHDGHVTPNHDDIISRPDVCGLLSNPLLFYHSLRLMSAYEACSGNEAQYTNYTEDFKGTLDYIWFSPDKVSALAVSAVDDEQTLQQEMALPSSTRPSDHISLVTTFMFREPPTTRNGVQDIADKQAETMTNLRQANQAKYARLFHETWASSPPEYFGDHSQQFGYNGFWNQDYGGGWTPAPVPEEGGYNPQHDYGSYDWSQHDYQQHHHGTRASKRGMMSFTNPLGGSSALGSGGISLQGPTTTQALRDAAPWTLGQLDPGASAFGGSAASEFSNGNKYNDHNGSNASFSPEKMPTENEIKWRRLLEPQLHHPQDTVAMNAAAVASARQDSLLSEEDPMRRPLSAMDLSQSSRAKQDVDNVTSSSLNLSGLGGASQALGGFHDTPNSRRGYSDDDDKWLTTLAASQQGGLQMTHQAGVLVPQPTQAGAPHVAALSQLTDQELLHNTLLQEQRSDHAHSMAMSMSMDATQQPPQLLGGADPHIPAAHNSHLMAHHEATASYTADQRMMEHMRAHLDGSQASASTSAKGGLSGPVVSSSSSSGGGLGGGAIPLAAGGLSATSTGAGAAGAALSGWPGSSSKTSSGPALPTVPPPPPPPPPPSLPPVFPPATASAEHPPPPPPSDGVVGFPDDNIATLLPPPSSQLPQHLSIHGGPLPSAASSGIGGKNRKSLAINDGGFHLQKGMMMKGTVPLGGDGGGSAASNSGSLMSSSSTTQLNKAPVGRALYESFNRNPRTSGPSLQSTTSNPNIRQLKSGMGQQVLGGSGNDLYGGGSDMGGAGPVYSGFNDGRPRSRNDRNDQYEGNHRQHDVFSPGDDSLARVSAGEDALNLSGTRLLEWSSSAPPGLRAVGGVADAQGAARVSTADGDCGVQSARASSSSAGTSRTADANHEKRSSSSTAENGAGGTAYDYWQSASSASSRNPQYSPDDRESVLPFSGGGGVSREDFPIVESPPFPSDTSEWGTSPGDGMYAGSMSGSGGSQARVSKLPAVSANGASGHSGFASNSASSSSSAAATTSSGSQSQYNSEHQQLQRSGGGQQQSGRNSSSGGGASMPAWGTMDSISMQNSVLASLSRDVVSTTARDRNGSTCSFGRSTHPGEQDGANFDVASGANTSLSGGNTTSSACMKMSMVPSNTASAASSSCCAPSSSLNAGGPTTSEHQAVPAPGTHAASHITRDNIPLDAPPGLSVGPPPGILTTGSEGPTPEFSSPSLPQYPDRPTPTNLYSRFSEAVQHQQMAASSVNNMQHANSTSSCTAASSSNGSPPALGNATAAKMTPGVDYGPGKDWKDYNGPGKDWKQAQEGQPQHPQQRNNFAAGGSSSSSSSVSASSGHASYNNKDWDDRPPPCLDPNPSAPQSYAGSKQPSAVGVVSSASPVHTSVAAAPALHMSIPGAPPALSGGGCGKGGPVNLPSVPPPPLPSNFWANPRAPMPRAPPTGVDQLSQIGSVPPQKKLLSPTGKAVMGTAPASAASHTTSSSTIGASTMGSSAPSQPPPGLSGKLDPPPGISQAGPPGALSSSVNSSTASGGSGSTTSTSSTITTAVTTSNSSVDGGSFVRDVRDKDMLHGGGAGQQNEEGSKRGKGGGKL